MSGAQTSTFPTMNDLLAPMAAYDTHANALLQQQERTQTLSANDIAMTGQAAAPLLGMSEEDAAKAYPGIIQELQARGGAKYAPATYPGHAATAALVQRAMSLPDQYKMGLMTSPGTQAILDRVFGTGGGGTGTGSGATTGATTIGGTDTAPINAAGDSRTRKAGEGGPPAAGTPSAQVAQQVHDFWIGKGYSEEQVAGIMAGGPGSESDFTPTVFGDKGTSYGLYQHHGPRLAAMQQFFGLSGSQMPSADQQNQYAHWEITQGPLANVGAQLKQAKTPAEAAAIWTAGFGVPADKTEIGRRARGADRYLGRYASQPQQGGPGGATAAATPPGVQMGGDVPPPPGGVPGAYPAMGAGVGAVVGGGVRPNIGGPQQTVAPPPVIRAQPIPAGRTTVGSNADIMMGGVQQAQATPLPGTQVAGPPMVASTNPTAPVAAPSVEAPPQPGWGSTVGSYGPQNTLAPPPPPAPPAVAAAPASQQPPAAAPSVATGVNSPQFQLAQQKLRQAAAIAAMPGYQYNPQLQAAAAFLKEQAAALAQADSVIQTPQGQVHTLTGKIDNPAQPNANYVWSPEQRAYIDTTGTHPPVTPPSPRFSPPTVDPATGKPAVAVEGGQGGTKYLPIPDRPATATFDLQKEQHKRDTDELPKYNEQNQQAAANQIRIQQMRELIDQISTGAGGAERANWANIAETMGWTDLSKRLVGMGGAAAAQEFAKYGLATAGAQERGDLGARGSLGAITLYKSANPGLELQPDANKKMLTAQLIAAQANRDYTQGAMDYVNRNGDAFVVHGANYTPLSHFDAEWAAQRSPQTYAAAMSAINGDPWQKWTKALNMKDATDVQRVVDIVRRADPTSSIMWKNGERHDVGTSQ